MRSGTYMANVWAFNATTGSITCTVPQLFGYRQVVIQAEIMRTTDIANIAPVANGDIVMVYFVGDDDGMPRWRPRVIDPAFDARFVNVSGDTMTGALAMPLGAVGTPSMTYVGDLNTGMYSPGADQLALVTAGVSRLSIGATGVVTVGGQIYAPGAAEYLRVATDGAYQSWFEATNVTRRGFLQGTATGMILASEAGTLKLNGAGGVSLTPFTINGYTGSETVLNNRIVLTNSLGYIATNYFNTTANVVAGIPPYLAGGGGDGFIRWYDRNGTFTLGGTFLDSRTGYTGPSFYTYGHPGSGSWVYANVVLYGAVSGGSAADFATISANPLGVAPQLRVHQTNGERWECVNQDNTAFAPFAALNFVTMSTIEIKEDLVVMEDGELLQKVANVLPHRYRYKRKPAALLHTARFDDVNDRWMAKGRKPLIPKGDHWEQHDHDCAIDKCAGTADRPCRVILSTKDPRIGLMAEHLHEHFPEVTNVDNDGHPREVEIDQIAALAFGGVGALYRRMQALEAQVAVLAAGSGAAA